jgi:hypothetical protein
MRGSKMNAHRGFFFALALIGCSNAPIQPETFVSCPDEHGEKRKLRGVCTIDTEHRVRFIHACTFNSGVRRYTTSNDPEQVQAQCRTMILDLVREFCETFPAEATWQASWVSFKTTGSAHVGSERLFGTCRPPAVQRDEWTTAVLTFD